MNFILNSSKIIPQKELHQDLSLKLDIPIWKNSIESSF